jgi:hypothetical protein
MDYIQLMGSEDVQRAGNSISAAADRMQRAANQISEALEKHSQDMASIVYRLEKIFEDHVIENHTKQEEKDVQIK